MSEQQVRERVSAMIRSQGLTRTATALRMREESLARLGAGASVRQGTLAQARLALAELGTTAPAESSAP